MKQILLITMVMIGLFVFSGCGEEFAAGMGTGAALVHDANAKVIEAVAELNARTEEINGTISSTGDMVVLKTDTIAAIRSLKGREKDPVTWVALASLLANTFVGGNAFSNRKKK